MSRKRIFIIISFCSVLLSLFFLNNSLSKYSFNSEISFKVSSDMYNIAFLEHTYRIYDINDSIPVVISNNNDYDIVGNISYNGTILVDNFTVLKNTNYDIINVSLTEDIFNSLVSGDVNYLDINMTSPYSHTYSNKVSFKLEQAPISIKSVVSSDGSTIGMNEDTISINNSLDSTNTTITYTVTFINNDDYSSYQLRNITSVVDSNTSNNYKASINLGDGIYIDSGEELSFDITYTYNSSLSDNSNREVIYFDFEEAYAFGGVTDHLISLSMPRYSSEESYGDFNVFTSGDKLISANCNYASCYSGNYGLLEYDASGGLILDNDNPIMTLDIDQSMSVANEYSIYTTLKADTSQIGQPTGTFPGTVLAISDEVNKYLVWFGFYNNYMHVYSYRASGSFANIAREYTVASFSSFNVSSYSNTTFNIQISATRGGATNVYINGVLVKSFTSGSTEVTFTIATIGDLRPGRGLKFQGTIYDMALYNKALSEEEITQNWEYAKKTWSLE